LTFSASRRLKVVDITQRSQLPFTAKKATHDLSRNGGQVCHANAR